MQWLVSGADCAKGIVRFINIAADTAEEATEIARQRGLTVQRVEPDDEGGCTCAAGVCAGFPAD